MHPDPTRNRHRQPTPPATAAIDPRPAAHVAGPAKLTPLHAGDEATVQELLVATQLQQLDVRDTLARLVELVDRRPAQLRDVCLKATEPIRRAEGWSAQSIGVYNPSAVTLYSSLGSGATPAPGRGALSFPGKSLVVLPLAVEHELTFGADPADLAAGDLLFWVLLFDQVQPAAMEAL